jgi:hypothetical protein
VESLLDLDSVRQVGFAIGEDPDPHGAELGATRDANRLPGTWPVKSGPVMT